MSADQDIADAVNAGSAPSVLAGINVWDAAWVGVGPLAAGYLANYGATVVHTETSKFADPLRNGPPFRNGVPGINRSHFFADFNPSKLGLGLDFLTEKGRDIGMRLAQWADVVVESFSPGIMDSFGLGWDVLHELNPGLIMLSTCMNGQTGPRHRFAGFGTSMAAQAGFAENTGWPDRLPTLPYGAYTDFIAQRFAAASLMAALDHKRRTGEGQLIDLSQYEAAAQMLLPALLEQSVNGRSAGRAGNSSGHAAPHNIYPCRPERGQDRWVAIAVETDAQWAALVAAIGDPEWARDARFATMRGRKANEPELDALLGEWTASRWRSEVFYALQPDVPAAPVNDAVDLHEDPQVLYRHYFQELEHTEMGPTLYERPQADLSLTPPRLSKAAPCIGEDTRRIMTDFLGYSHEDVDELVDEGVLEEYGSQA